jgi:hypothetical protein
VQLQGQCNFNGEETTGAGKASPGRKKVPFLFRRIKKNGAAAHIKKFNPT